MGTGEEEATKIMMSEAVAAAKAPDGGRAAGAGDAAPGGRGGAVPGDPGGRWSRAARGSHEGRGNRGSRIDRGGRGVGRTAGDDRHGGDLLCGSAAASGVGCDHCAPPAPRYPDTTSAPHRRSLASRSALGDPGRAE